MQPGVLPYSALILPVKKGDGTYRLVQDLREINKLVQIHHPVVPNPYTIMSKIPHEGIRFSVIDLKDAFWAEIFLHLSGKTQTWEESNNLGGLYSPQGFSEAPNLFGQALEGITEKCRQKDTITVLQYVDDFTNGWGSTVRCRGRNGEVVELSRAARIMSVQE